MTITSHDKWYPTFSMDTDDSFVQFPLRLRIVVLNLQIEVAPKMSEQCSNKILDIFVIPKLNASRSHPHIIGWQRENQFFI